MRKIQYIILSAVFSYLTLAATSCESFFDSEQDCSTKIKFEFRKHRQALQTVNGNPADVFDAAVGSVHLFIYSAENGNLVYEQFSTVENLKTESELNIGTGNNRCYMPVDIAPGKYRIVAWCGLDNNDRNNAFALGEASRAAYNYDECSVKLSAVPYQPVHDEKYDALFHGAVAEATIAADGEVITVQLTKNTNDIAVWVQHVSASFESGDYEVVFADANGYMKFDDNTLTRTDRLEYHAYSSSLLSADTEYNGERMETGALIAHISTARLMEAHKKDARLEVRNKDGVTVFSVPFIQYLLEMQTFTSNGQYYLDCEDTYNCSFYLTGDGDLWMPARIIINNWVKVPDQLGNI